MDSIIKTIDTLRGHGWSLGKMEAARFAALVSEAELLYVRPALGDEFYNTLVDNPDADEYETVMNGGRWEDSDGVVHVFAGLKAVISYYVHAQDLMAGDLQTTRYGNVLKDSEYSQRASSKERSDAYNNALEIGNSYMRDVITYCGAQGYIINANHRKRGAGAVRIRKIGS